MAITGTVSRSKQNDFLEIFKDEESLKEVIDNVAGRQEDFHVTLHAGDYDYFKSLGTSINIPENVYVTILPSASNVEADDTIQEKNPVNTPDNDTEFPDYNFFDGYTENIADHSRLNFQDFYQRANWSVQHNPDLKLKGVKLDNLIENEVLFSETDGKIEGSPKLTYEKTHSDFESLFSLNGTQIISEELFLSQKNENEVLFAEANGRVEGSSDLKYEKDPSGFVSLLSLTGSQTISQELFLSNRDVPGGVLFASDTGRIKDTSDLRYDENSNDPQKPPMLVIGEDGGDLLVKNNLTVNNLTTSGGIPFTTSDGFFQDSSDLTFDQTTLDVNAELNVSNLSTFEDDVEILNDSTLSIDDTGGFGNSAIDISGGSTLISKNGSGALIGSVVGNSILFGFRENNGDTKQGLEINDSSDLTRVFTTNFQLDTGTSVNEIKTTIDSNSDSALVTEGAIIEYTFSDLDGRYVSETGTESMEGPLTIQNSLEVQDSITVQNSLTVQGDFTVQGDILETQTETIEVDDNTIELNSDVNSGTPPVVDSGIKVLRGNETTASLIWKESQKYWAVGLDGNEDRILTTDDELIISTNSGIDASPASVSVSDTLNIDHADTSAIPSPITFNDDEIISEIQFDGFGHVESISTQTVDIPDPASVSTKTATLDGNGGNNRTTLDLETIFSVGTETNRSNLQVFIKDTVSGSPTEGEFIDAVGVVTIVKRPHEYEVINEHPNSQEFQFVIHNF